MIYLDSAATTLQKPPSVPRAAARAIQTMASPGRGGHSAAISAAEAVFRCRESAAELFDVESPEQVVFTMNATHGLNLAISSLVKEGDRVITSGYEHNAVTRPLNAKKARVAVAESELFRPDMFLDNLERLLREEERPSAVICTHMSNVFGYILPMNEAALLCRNAGVPLIVDASQSAGTLPVRLGKWGAAYIAMPGHKGLYGPQGTGVLLCGSGQQPEPLICGGTGSVSLSQEMPEFLPDRLEGGTHNVPGIAGLDAGIAYVRKRGTAEILRHERQLTGQLIHGLNRINSVKVFYDTQKKTQGNVVSFYVPGTDCEELGMRLGRRGAAVRAGLHCAPWAHRSAGTLDTGTVRVSVSAFNTAEEIDVFLWILREIL